MNYRITYPVEREVSEEEIRSKLSDAKENGELLINVNPQTVSIDTAILLLEDIGRVSFAHKA